jgi:hypothetical protein
MKDKKKLSIEVNGAKSFLTINRWKIKLQNIIS